MGDRKIPNPVIAVVAGVLGSHYYNPLLSQLGGVGWAEATVS
jgi:hypothetical protein